MASKGRVIKNVSNLDEHSYRHVVARGSVDGTHVEAVYGEFVSGGAVTHNILQPTGLGSDLLVLPATGVQLAVQSNSPEDDPAGTGTSTGVHEIHIHYLDANLDEKDETLTLSGTTPVNTVATNIRHVQCVHLVAVGSAGAAVGDITLEYSGTPYSMMQAGDRRCTSSVRRVPRGKALLITDIWGGSVSGSGNVDSAVRLGGTFVNDVHDLTEDGIFMPFAGIAIQNTSTALPVGMPIRIPEGRIVAMEVDAGGSGCQIIAGYAGYYEDV